MDGLIARMEECLERMEHAMQEGRSFGNAFPVLADVEGTAAAGEKERGREEPEEMYFDESWLPKAEFDGEDVRLVEEMPVGDVGKDLGSDNRSQEEEAKEDDSQKDILVLESDGAHEAASEGNSDGPKLDEVPEETEFGNDPVGEGEALVPELDDVPEISAEDGLVEGFMPALEDGGAEGFPLGGQGSEAGDEAEEAEASDAALPVEDGAGAVGAPSRGESALVKEEVFRSGEEVPRRYRRLMAAATRILAMEKRRFLGKDSDAQREFLLKRLLEKKAGASKVNAFKKLFGNFSNEYLYDLVVRDATEAELENLLILSQS